MSDSRLLFTFPLLKSRGTKGPLIALLVGLIGEVSLQRRPFNWQTERFILLTRLNLNELQQLFSLFIPSQPISLRYECLNQQVSLCKNYAGSAIGVRCGQVQWQRQLRL